MADESALYGWTAVPRKVSDLLAGAASAPPQPLTAADLVLPSTPLAQAVLSYAKAHLAPETLNHSLRAFHYGIAIARFSFPRWLDDAATGASFVETYFLTCMLHDIGTTDENIAATRLSFEFYGGFITLDVLKGKGAPVAQAESVAEAVIRHQDLGETGTLTKIGALVQLATIFDNMGGNPSLVHRETIEAVVAAYPRQKWSACFARTIRKENGLKPWAHTTHLGERDFPEGVEGNELMAPWD